MFSRDHIKEFLSDKVNAFIGWVADYAIIIPTSLAAIPAGILTWFISTGATAEIPENIPTDGDYQLQYLIIAIVMSISRIAYKWRVEIKSIFKNKKGDKKPD